MEDEVPEIKGVIFRLKMCLFLGVYEKNITASGYCTSIYIYRERERSLGKAP